jgi:hypothetical protein
MGHATHFLSRLDRLELPEVELALSLYRDPKLLRAVINWANIPEGHERVAIGLRQEEGGPHLIVTRGGDFVTCLGAGMKVGDHPVISRARFDGIASRIETLRERNALARSITEPGHRTRQLLMRVLTAGHALAREDFLATCSFAPLIRKFLLVQMTKMADRCRDEWAPLASLVATLGPRIKRKRDDLLRFWNRLWAVGHYVALLSEGIRDFAAVFTKQTGELLPCLTIFAFDSGFVPSILRAMRLPLQLGKSALPVYKMVYRSCCVREDLLHAVSGLIAIGLGHSSLRAQVRKELERPPQTLKDPAFRARLGEFQSQLATDPGFAATAAVACGDKAWNLCAKALPKDSPWRRENCGTEAEQAAFALWTACNAPFHREEQPALVLCLVPAAALLPVEELYLPGEKIRDLCAHLGADWAFDQTVRMLDCYRKHGAVTPVRAADQPGPNERCSCGSGKKFKRCCMPLAS